MFKTFWKALKGFEHEPVHVYNKHKVKCKKGSWVAVAMGGGAAISAGGSYLSAREARKGGEGGGFEEAPQFPESEQARKTMWGKLSQWGDEPGFGAISPDWGSLWERAKTRVKRAYGGYPSGEPGVTGKVKASLAARNVAEGPQREKMLTRAGIAEAGELKDISTEQTLQEALFGERGRGDYMNWLSRLSGDRPGSQYIPDAGGGDDGFGGALSGLGGALGQYGAQKSQQNWLEKMLGYGGGVGGDGAYGGYTPTSGIDYMPNVGRYTEGVSSFDQPSRLMWSGQDLGGAGGFVQPVG